MTPETKYYECHLTIDPVEGERLNLFECTCSTYKFKVAKLLMQKGELNDKDAFCTGHSKEYSDIFQRMTWLNCHLLELGFTVRRYKIEAVIFDSRAGDKV